MLSLTKRASSLSAFASWLLRLLWLACLAAALHAQPAHATYVCTDPWGRSLSLPSVPSHSITKLQCRLEATALPSLTQNATAQDRAQALGIAAPSPQVDKRRPTQPSETSPNQGGLVLVSTGEPSILDRWPQPAPQARPAQVEPALRTLIGSAAKRYGHDEALLLAVAHAESGFNPAAVSPKGAIGVMQVMPATGSRMGVQDPKKALFDPTVNIGAGARYLRTLVDMFPKRLDLAVAAYNAGENAVLRYKSTVPPYPETQAYVKKVLSLYQGYGGQL
jgi:soluble lytic murein transglycosylase-like protein